MACEVVQTELGQAFICGETEPLAPCHFCGDPSLYLCDFKVEKVIAVPAADVRLGDWICQGRSRWGVIYRSHDEEYVYLGIDKGGGGTVLQTKVPRSGSFCLLRPVTCDNPCCENCVRELDEDIHHCIDHWNAWREIQ